jgi:integrase
MVQICAKTYKNIAIDTKNSGICCPKCGSNRIYHRGFRPAPLNAISKEPIQRYCCAEYGHSFSNHLKVKRNHNRTCQISANLGAKNLVSTQEIKTCAELEKSPTQNEIKAIPQIERLMQQLENDGRKQNTITNYRKALRALLKAGADLFDPENTKYVLAKLPLKGTSKKTMTAMLTVWFEFNGISWKPPRYVDSPELPYIPTEAELDQFIACFGKTVAVYLQLLKDTGARCGEIKALKWIDIDFGQRKVWIKAEKGSNSRILPLSAKTIDMLSNLPRNRERLFVGDQHTNFSLQRKRKAKQLGNPNFMRIHFHTLRHWKGTTEQHLCKDIYHVNMILGQKSLDSTKKYLHLEKMLYEGTSDQFIVKVADSLDDAVKLMEVGFEFHAEIEGHKLFRKRR